MDKRERAERAKEEDAILNKVLLWIAGAVVFEALLLLLNKFYVNPIVRDIPIQAGILSALKVLIFIFPLCFVAAVVWMAQTKKKGGKLGFSIALSTIFAALSVCAIIARFYKDVGVRFLYVAVPVAAVLAMIYYLYQREFFIVTLLGAGGLMGLWLLQRKEGHAALVYTCLIALGVVLVACVVVARLLQSKDGVLVLKGKSYQVLDRKSVV